MKKEIQTNKSVPVGPYSSGITFGNLVFVSGQIGKDPKNDNLAQGIGNQTRFTLQNISEVLKAGGSDIKNVLKTTVYIANMDDYAAMNEVYASFFEKPYPTRATIQVTKLPKDALVEIECIAYRNVDDDCCGENCCGKCK